MNFREILLSYPQDRKRLEDFLEKHDLSFEKDIEYSIVLEDKDEIVGTGSVAGKILKCLALEDAYQGLGYSNQIVSKLMEYQAERGRTHLFIFTKPEYQRQMEDFGFRTVALVPEKVVLLDNRISSLEEFRQNIKRELEERKESLQISKEDLEIASIVMNANPFTKGHRYLVDYAAKENDFVILFVVEENRSKFSFATRFRAVKEGLSDLKNVLVLPGGDYIISSATFPSYFLKEEKLVEDAYAKLDARIFAEHIASPLGISKRYLGEEPLDVVTKNYNDNLQDILEKFLIAVKIIPRKKSGEEVISASYFRKLLAEKKYEEAKTLVPETTFRILEEEGYLRKD